MKQIKRLELISGVEMAIGSLCMALSIFKEKSMQKKEVINKLKKVNKCHRERAKRSGVAGSTNIESSKRERMLVKSITSYMWKTTKDN